MENQWGYMNNLWYQWKSMNMNWTSIKFNEKRIKIIETSWKPINNLWKTENQRNTWSSMNTSRTSMKKHEHLWRINDKQWRTKRKADENSMTTSTRSLIIETRDMKTCDIRACDHISSDKRHCANTSCDPVPNEIEIFHEGYSSTNWRGVGGITGPYIVWMRDISMAPKGFM